jgi:diguanylate cyclase (GGDEF)-like protein
MYHALIVADVDHFKKFNDTYGHPVGDRVLGVVAAVMKSTLRKDVFLARTGGEEFAIILEGTSLEVTLRDRRALRRTAVESTPLKNQKTGLDYGPITLSLGICMASDADSAEELYNKADVALYRQAQRPQQLHSFTSRNLTRSSRRTGPSTKPEAFFVILDVACIRPAGRSRDCNPATALGATDRHACWTACGEAVTDNN